MGRDNNDKAGATRRMILLAAGSVASFIGLGASVAYAAKASQASVGYRDAPNGEKNCAGCALFMSPADCKSVASPVSPNGWCRIWKKA